MADELDEQAVLGLVRHDGRSRLSSLHETVAIAEVEIALRVLAAVAAQTGLGEHRLDVALEDLQSLGHLRGMIGRQLDGRLRLARRLAPVRYAQSDAYAGHNRQHPPAAQRFHGDSLTKGRQDIF